MGTILPLADDRFRNEGRLGALPLNKKEFKKYKKYSKNLKRTVYSMLPLIILCVGMGLINSRLAFYGFEYIEISEWGAPDL